MKDFLKNHGLWILFAGAVIAVALALLSYFSTNASPLVDLANTITSPFRAVCTSVSGWFTDKQNYYEDVTALKAENEALKKQIAEMEATVRQGEAASQENVFLRDLLDLRQQRRDLSDFETATVTERGVTNWTASLTLNKGAVHGVEVGDCVIDGQGRLVGRISLVGYNWSTVLTVVGRISKAGYDWSTVLTVIDTDTSLGARVYRTKDIGIAGGDFALMDDGKLKLDSLPASCQLLEGDLVVTSGLGGYLPPDLVIGSVSELRADDSDTSNYAILTPAADLNGLTEVCIIKSFEIVS